MPFYEFECPECGVVSDYLVSIGTKKTTCSDGCGKEIAVRSHRPQPFAPVVHDSTPMHMRSPAITSREIDMRVGEDADRQWSKAVTRDKPVGSVDIPQADLEYRQKISSIMKREASRLAEEASDSGEEAPHIVVGKKKRVSGD